MLATARLHPSEPHRPGRKLLTAHGVERWDGDRPQGRCPEFLKDSHHSEECQPSHLCSLDFLHVEIKFWRHGIQQNIVLKSISPVSFYHFIVL